MSSEQHVCLACGFNMIGFRPDRCPFCGARSDRFITAEECSERFRVKGTPVHDKVTRLSSVPSLGLEHAAYRVETGHGPCWIDCPSSFDRSLSRAETILFTHHHFLGASNLYRGLFSAEVRIHLLDSLHDICRPFPFDVAFERNFTHHGIEAFHLAGHTPGFTCYLFEDVLFICDYVFLTENGMKYNPFGPAEETIAGGDRLRSYLDGRALTTVCGYNYTIGYDDWRERFDRGPVFGGY